MELRQAMGPWEKRAMKRVEIYSSKTHQVLSFFDFMLPPTALARCSCATVRTFLRSPRRWERWETGRVRT
jgi:hypothetical protein